MKIWMTLMLVLASSVAGAQTVPGETSAEDRIDVAVTAYNNGLALVRDVRRLSLPGGESGLKFSDVAAQIRPETVSLRSLTSGRVLRVIEQNYEYDLVSPQKLMEKYVGRNVRLVNFHKDLGFESVEAELISMNQGPVFRVNGEIFLGHPGSVVLPEIPDNLTARPSLIWTIDSDQGGQDVEASYLTNGISWRADYVVTLARDDKQLDLDGWVTLDNQSGATYSNARVKLVAGDVNRVPDDFRRQVEFEEKALRMADAAEMPAQEAFAEFHLYSLPRRTTIKQNQSKQVTLLAADGVRAAKKYEYRGQEYYYSQRVPPMTNEHVDVFLDFRNEENNALGIPLPAGVMRIYQEDSEGMLQFAGEDRIEHTPKDERVRLRMGGAFDVIGERVQTDYQVLGGSVHESEYRVTLRNHKEQDIVVDVVEPMPGDWRILSSSMPFEKRDARTAVFSTPVKADGEVVITYRVRVRY
jgi:hypothetical protein